MATVASFTLTSGTYTSSFGPKYYGFASDETTYNDQIGAINGDTGEYSVPVAWYPNTTIWSLTWLDYYNDLINLRLKGSSGIPANSGWESMSVTGAVGTYNRVDASYTSQSSTSTAAWIWASTFNPFFSGNYLVTIDNGVPDDTTPDQFSLGSDVSDVIRNSHTFRNFLVSGINSATTFTTNNSLTKVSLDNSTWTTSVSCTNGQQVYVRAQSASTYSTTTTHTVSAGGVSDSFTTTTEDMLVLPDTSITVAKNTPLFNSSSFQVKLTSTTNTTSYEIRSGNYSGTVLKTITNQEGVWVTVNNQPSTSGTTYYVTAFVSTANGGDESRSNVTTFTVTRSSEVNPDTTITQSPSDDITTSNSTFTKSITNANSNSVTDYRLLRTTGTDTVYDTYTGTATSFTLTGDMPTSGSWTYVIQARVPTANNGDGTWVNAGSSFTVTKSSSGSSSGGTTYDKYGSTTDITQNIFNDDLINVYYNVQGADANKSWLLASVECSATPSAGFFYSGHPVGSTFMSYLSNFSGSSYSAEFFVEDTSKFTISGTVTDPYGVTNISFSSKTVTPGNGTATTESVAQTFDTFREGETLDYSVTGGELYNGSAWGTSGTVADGASIKLRGITPAIYSGSKTVTVTFSKNSVTKRTESFVIYTPALTAPTDITFVNDGDSSATEQVTVTASGGTSGTIKVSNDGTNWYSNGTKFNHIRGTSVTYYARREGVNSLTSSNYTEAHAVSCIAPTNLTFVNDGDASSTEDVTVTASGGYGGTLEVSSDGSTWYANGTTFDQSRNTSVTYYARRKATYSSSNYTEDHSVGYLAPLAYSYTVSGSNPLNYSDSGFNVTISGADASHTYRVLHDGVNAGTRTTDGNIAVQFSELPLPGGQKTYTVQAVRAASIGGSGAYVTKSTFIRSVRPSTPSVSPSIAATESSTTNVTVSASSTGAAEYRFSNNGTNYTAWGTSSSYVFENQSRGTAYTYYVQSRSAVAESLVGSSTTTVPYLAPKAFSYSVSDSDPLAYNDGGFNVTIAGADANHSYQVLHNGSNAGTRTSDGDILVSGSELPSAGSIKTYTVRALRNTSIGGSGTYQTVYSFTRSMRPSNPTVSASATSTESNLVDVTVSGASTGANQYRFSKDNGGTYTAWQTSSSYIFEDLSRGTAYTFKVEAKSTYAVAASAGSLTYTVSYLSPKGFTYTVSDPDPLAYGDAGFNVTIAGADTDHSYRVLHGSTVAGFRTDNGDILISGSELPSAGGLVTYTVQALRYTQIGGSGSYVNISTFTRSMRPSNPTLSSSGFGSDTSATTSRTITAPSTGATQYRFKISPAANNSGVFSAWQSSSSFTFDVAAYGIGRGDSVTTVVEARSSNANAANNLTLVQTVPYLTPETSVSIPSTAYTVGSNTATQDIVITGVGNNETIRITGEDSVTAAAKGNATLTVDTPTSGSVGTYQIEIQRDTASGGNGTTWYNTNKSFTITRGSNATPVIDLFIPAPSSTVGEETVTLSTTGITDSDGTISTITITQVSGTNVTLSNVTTTGTGTASATASTTFTSPNGSGSLVFRVTATDDDGGTSSKDVLVTTSESSVVLPPTEGLHGLEVYGPNDELYLSVTDKLVIFLDNPVGYLPQNQQSVDITIVGNPTHVIWLNAPAALTLASLEFTLTGNTLNIARASASTTSIYYEVLVLGE